MERFEEYLKQLTRVMLAERIDAFRVIRCYTESSGMIFALEQVMPTYRFSPIYLKLGEQFQRYSEVEPPADEQVFGLRLRAYVAGAFKGFSSRATMKMGADDLTLNRAANVARLLDELDIDRLYLGYGCWDQHRCGVTACMRKLVEGERTCNKRLFTGKVAYRAGFITSNTGVTQYNPFWTSLGEWKPANTDAYANAIIKTGADPQTGIGRSSKLKCIQENSEGITCHEHC